MEKDVVDRWAAWQDMVRLDAIAAVCLPRLEVSGGHLCRSSPLLVSNAFRRQTEAWAVEQADWAFSHRHVTAGHLTGFPDRGPGGEDSRHGKVCGKALQ